MPTIDNKPLGATGRWDAPAPKPVAPVAPVARPVPTPTVAPIKTVAAQPVEPKLYAYGEDVKDASGKVIGQARFDTATGKPLAAPSVLTSTTPAAETNTPIGSVFNLPTLSNVTDEENALGELYRKQAAGEDIVDTSKIRSETLAEFQDRINSLNRIYDQQLARARQAGVGRVGQGTAVLAARGLAGSGRGMAVQDSILDQNRQEQETIDAERQAALAEVYGAVNTQAIEAARSKREAILGGAKSYIEFLKGSEERKKANLGSTVAALLTQGIDPSTMSPDELNSITSKIGASSSELLAAFKEGKVARDASQSELARKIAKEEAELGKITTETQLMKDKFEDDKRRFGLEYAIKQAGAGNPGGLTPYQQFSATQAIAKDTQARTDGAREMARQAQLIDQSYNNIVKGGDRSLNTQAIITSFNKILDPASVVRESEYDRTAEGQSLIAQLEGKVQNIASGGAGVTEATLKEAAEIGKLYLAGARKSIDAQNKRAQAMATQFGLNPDFVTSTYQDGGATGGGGVEADPLGLGI